MSIVAADAVLADNENGENVAVASDSCPGNTEEAGRAAACAGCPGAELCRSAGGPDPERTRQDEQLAVRMKAIKYKILILSGKGGVGKSTVACNLARALALAGHRVGLLDVDLCGPSVPRLMQVRQSDIVNTSYGWLPAKDPEHGVAVLSAQYLLARADDALVWRGPRKTNLIKQFLRDTYWGPLDYLLVDTPPGTSDEHLTVIEALKADAQPDGALLVATPARLAADTVRREVTFCQKLGVPVLGLVENMAGYACSCCQELTPVFGEPGALVDVVKRAFSFGASAQLPEEPLSATLPIATDVAMCGDSGVCILCQAPESAVSRSFVQLAASLHGFLEERRQVN